jgi:3-deoxy-D-manno-octulosonic-acid transferase
MALAYDMIYALAGAASSPLWGANLLRTGKWRTDWPARLGRCAIPRDPRPTLLIHAVSVGEINAIRLLVEELQQRAGDRIRLVISTTTDTGTDRARSLYADRMPVVRYPLDFSPCVNRFLDQVQPSVMALTELEVWPNMVYECARRSIPVAVINGRLSPGSFRNYQFARAFVRSTFARITAAAVQTETYAQRFVDLGVPASRTLILDTMKWDTAQIADSVPGAEDLAAAMGIDRGKPLIVAGSTGVGEEQLLLDACPHDAQLMLVPRRPERFDEVARLAPAVVRRTACPDGSQRAVDGTRWFLLDTMGELRKAYSLADVALVGRSFLPGLGGSDPLEPVALGKPVAIGPHHTNFTDVVEALQSGGGIEVTKQPGEFAGEVLINRKKADALAERGRNVIRARQGATRRHADLLLSMMSKHNND